MNSSPKRLLNFRNTNLNKRVSDASLTGPQLSRMVEKPSVTTIEPLQHHTKMIETKESKFDLITHNDNFSGEKPNLLM
jgi:hypothetical protein